MALPGAQDPLVDPRGFFSAFDAQRVRVIVIVGRWRLQMDHAVIARKLSFTLFAKRLPHAHWTGPVRSSVDSAAVTQHHGYLVAVASDELQFALNAEDSPLRGRAFERYGRAWEPTPKQDACGFR
jgi:hypothetical protein